MQLKFHLPKLSISFFREHIIVLCLFCSASLVLMWVGWLTWIDVSVWNKDLGAIFFGSRTGEGISLGIGMTVINYFLIGMSLLAAGIVLFLKDRIFVTKPQQVMPVPSRNTKIKNQEASKTPINNTKAVPEYSAKDDNVAAREERFFSGCLHHFGYLSSRPKDSPIPQECIICQRLGDCMVATVYVKKIDE